MFLRKGFQPGSSPVDWCESNYQVSAYIAEFYNTVSNVPLILLPILIIKLSSCPTHPTVRDVHTVAKIIAVAGLSSLYFHATLSFYGQLADELAILWAITLVVALFYPSRRFPVSYFENRNNFKRVLYTSALIVTLLSFTYPWINALCLILLTVPLAYVAAMETRTFRIQRTNRLGCVSSIVWLIAVTIWIFDRVMCSWWLQIGFPYLHSIWHILVGLNSIQALTVFACIHAAKDLKNQSLMLKYWPLDKYEFLIPYIQSQSVA